MNPAPLVAAPDTETTTIPLVAPEGTGTTIDVALQLVGVPDVPLNETVLLPWLVPKFVPVMTTEVPTAPAVGDTPEIVGDPEPGPVTVKPAPLLGVPDTVTTTFPVVAPVGTLV
jgi:hypothetical protein